MIDTDDLRDDLLDYFGTAMQVNPVAMMDVIRVENASEAELASIAFRNGFNLADYDKSDDFPRKLTR